MKLTEEIERAILEYLSDDDSDEREFKSLQTIYENLRRPKRWDDTFNIEMMADDSQLSSILDSLVVDGLLESQEGGYDKSYRLTDQGFYEAVVDDEALIPSRPSIKPIQYDPDSWTGSRLIYVDSAQWKQIRITARQLQTATRRINYVSDEEKSDVQGLADALVSLCEMAEPEVTLIERILSHPKFKIYAALAGGIATIRGMLGI